MGRIWLKVWRRSWKVNIETCTSQPDIAEELFVYGAIMVKPIAIGSIKYQILAKYEAVCRWRIVGRWPLILTSPLDNPTERNPSISAVSECGKTMELDRRDQGTATRGPRLSVHDHRTAIKRPRSGERKGVRDQGTVIQRVPPDMEGYKSIQQGDDTWQHILAYGVGICSILMSLTSSESTNPDIQMSSTLTFSASGSRR